MIAIAWYALYAWIVFMFTSMHFWKKNLQDCIFFPYRNRICDSCDTFMEIISSNFLWSYFSYVTHIVCEFYDMQIRLLLLLLPHSNSKQKMRVNAVKYTSRMFPLSPHQKTYISYVSNKWISLFKIHIKHQSWRLKRKNSNGYNWFTLKEIYWNNNEVFVTKIRKN